MMLALHKNLLRVVVLVLCFFVALCAFDPAWAGELLYRFKVPVILKNIPDNVKYVVVRWTVFDGQAGEMLSDEQVLPLQKGYQGGYSTLIDIEIFDSDIDDLSKPSHCVISLKLSQEGDVWYFPNTPGKSWTQSKANTKVVKVVSVIKLQEKPEKGLSG